MLIFFSISEIEYIFKRYASKKRKTCKGINFPGIEAFFRRTLFRKIEKKIAFTMILNTKFALLAND